MTCQYNTCDRDAIGTVEWVSGTVRDYCQKHIQDTRVDFPELVKEVRLT